MRVNPRVSLDKNCSKNIDSNLSILQNCKNLPKDDKLFLRKLLFQGNQVVTQFMANLKPFANKRFNSSQIIWGSMIDQNKKAQIKLRKFIQQLKLQQKQKNIKVSDQKQNQRYLSFKKSIRRASINHKKQEKQPTAIKFVQKRNIFNYQHYAYRHPYQRNILQQKKRNYHSVDEQRDPRRTNKQTNIFQMKNSQSGFDNCAFNSKRNQSFGNFSVSIIDNQQQHLSEKKCENLVINRRPRVYYAEEKIIKRSKMSESMDFLNIESEIGVNQRSKQKGLSSFYNNISNTKLASSCIVDCSQAQIQDQNIFTDPKILHQCKQFLNKNRTGVYSLNSFDHHYQFNSTFQQKEILFENTRLCENYQSAVEQVIKRHLIGKYSEDIFDFIIDENVKQANTYAGSFFMSYEQFVSKLNQYFVTKCGGRLIKAHASYQVKYLSTKDMNLPIFAPFSTQYQSITFEKFTKFLQTYSFNRINPIRNLYLELVQDFEGGVSIQNFNKSAEFKDNSSELISLFRKLVNKYGKWGQNIGYWEMYWAKDSQQMKQFFKAYLQSRNSYVHQKAIQARKIQISLK